MENIDNPSIEKQLQTVVEENISSVEMGVFKREMDRLHQVEKVFVELRETHDELKEAHNKLVAKYNVKLEDFNSMVERESTLVNAEADMRVEKTELHIAEQLLNLRLENANVRVTDHINMVGQIFRGRVMETVIKKTGTEAIPEHVAINDSGSIAHSGTSGYVNTEETTTETEK